MKKNTENEKRNLLKQALEEFFTLDNEEQAIVSGFMSGIKMGRKIKGDKEKVS